MKWWHPGRPGLREKIVATHLLVVTACTLALIVSVILLSPAIFPSDFAGSDQIMWVMAPALVVVIVTVAGVVAAAFAARWLFRQIASPVQYAASVARTLARGHQADRIFNDKQKRLANYDRPLAESGDILAELVAALSDLSAQLEAAERRRTESFGEITHELRTPVAVLEGYFEGLLDGHVKPSDKTWAMLYDEASRVHRLVDDLQRLSRLEARQEPPDLQAIEPQKLVQAALDRMQLHFAEKGLSITTNIAPDLPRVLADPDHALQVLVNLLTNALRYTPVPGSVTLSVDRAEGGSEVAFHVADTGAGIAAEHIPHLYDRFFRVDRSSGRGAGGSGIGLPVAKALVEAMGGQIWAQSPGIGQGSTFSFTLLVAPDPVRP